MVRGPSIWRSGPIRALILFVGGLVLVILMVTIARDVFTPSDSTTDSRPQAEIGQEPVRSPQKQTRDAFGPWTVGDSSSVSSSGQSLVMLLDTGGIDTSTWSVAVDSTWKPAQPFQIVDSTVAGQTAWVRLSNHKTYALGVGQPFIIESAPLVVYAVVSVSDGQDSVVEQSTEWVKAHAVRTGR